MQKPTTKWRNKIVRCAASATDRPASRNAFKADSVTSNVAGSGANVPAKTSARAYRTQAEIFPNMGHDMMLEPGWLVS